MKNLLVIFLFTSVWTEYIPPGPRYVCPKDKLLLHPCMCTSETDFGISVQCGNANLAQMGVALNNLATFQLPIEKLLIFKCNLSRLFGSLLYKLQLRILHIEDTPIETIDEHSFLGINNTLNEIYLIKTFLKEFPSSAFKILGNLTTLIIDGHNLTELPKDAFAESNLSNKLTRLHITNGLLSSVPIESLQPLKKLKSLNLQRNNIQELKRNQFKGLRDVEVLDLSYNNITKIDATHVGDLIKLGWCNVSHNNIRELVRGAFARNTVLKLLNMSHNKLKKLDTNSFKGMRFLRRLYFSDNQISDVGRGTFGTVTRIGTIDLARNLLTKIDYQMFYQLNFVEVIDVSENNVKEVQKYAFKDLYLAHINLSRNAIKKIEAGAFENCINITVLDLSHNQLKNFSQKSFDELTYATELQLSYNMLTVMDQVPIAHMHGLKILNVSHNQITRIPKATFPKLYELHTIDISYNNLSDIFNSVFQTLFSLRNLDLSYNQMDTIKPSTFGTIPTLLQLNLTHNNLKDIARSAFTRLSSMRILLLNDNKLNNLFQLPISVSHLDISKNELTSLPPKFWPTMNSLLSMDISFNNLGENLEKGSFENLLTLQKLNLSYNGISKTPWAALSDLSSLQYLYLQGNEITQLPKGAFGNLPVLFEVNLADNKIFNVSRLAFQGLLQLLALDLSHNNISYIPNGAFQGLVSLRKLDLSFNNIEKLDNKTHGLLDDCLSLEMVNLSHNKISFITRKTFPSSPYIPYKLKVIDLSYNIIPLLTYDLVIGGAHLEKVNVSHNVITDLRKGVIGNLTQLRILDLSFNKLEDISSEEEFFKIPRNISEIILNNNDLKDLPWKNFKRAMNLTKLDIRFNSFPTLGVEVKEIAEQNTMVYFEGNPLNCDCSVRPFHRFLQYQLNLEEYYKVIKCQRPPHLLDEFLFKVNDELLSCPEDTKLVKENHLYDLTPDLEFRTIERYKHQITMKWRVVKNEDIADTYIIITSIKDIDEIIFDRNLPYFQRKFILDDSLYKGSLKEKDELQICIVARDSKYRVRNFYKQQCKILSQISRSNEEHITPNLFLCILLLVLTYHFSD